MIGLRTVSFFTLASLACSSHAAPCGEHLRPAIMFSTLEHSDTSLISFSCCRYAVAHGNADVAEFLRANGAAEVEGGRLSISPSAAGEEVPETFTNPSPRSAGEASAGAASL